MPIIDYPEKTLAAAFDRTSFTMPFYFSSYLESVLRATPSFDFFPKSFKLSLNTYLF